MYVLPARVPCATWQTGTRGLANPAVSCHTISIKERKPMITYTLSWPADNDEFINLDDARDVAFEVAKECGEVIYIYENFGASSNKIEEVAA